MEQLMKYLEGRFPTLNDIDKAHLVSLISDVKHKVQLSAFDKGWHEGRIVGTKEGETAERLRHLGWESE